MKVYTKVDGRLAMWDVETADPDMAIFTVRKELKRKPGGGAVLAVVPKYVQLELDFG